MNIYIVRHGETESNRLGYFAGSEVDINAKGIEQAIKLRELVKDLNIDKFYCSPLLRATHTADLIIHKTASYEICSELTERKPLKLAGKQLNLTDRDEYWNLYSTIDYGAESVESLFNRVSSFIDKLKTEHYNNVLIVCHSGVSKAFYAYFNGIPTDGRFLHLGLHNCEVKKYVL